MRTLLAIACVYGIDVELRAPNFWFAAGFSRHGVNIYLERGPWTEDRSPAWDVTILPAAPN